MNVQRKNLRNGRSPTTMSVAAAEAAAEEELAGLAAVPGGMEAEVKQAAEPVRNGFMTISP